MEIVFLIVGLVIGIVFTFLIYKFRAKVSTEVYDNKNKELAVQVSAQSQIVSEKEKTILELTRDLGNSNTEIKFLNQKLEENKAEIEKLYDKFNIQFKNLANDILEEKSKKFTEQNKTNITELLNPLKEKIQDFEKKVEDTYDKESKLRFSLKEEVKRLAELNQQVSKEANNLTRALKGETKTQGNWGEVILESILEKSGLAKDREYFVQNSFTDEEGKRQQPDVVVTYPGSRSVVVDSKVSLVAYERYVTAEEESDKELALKEHILSLRSHINNLASKNYQDLYQLNSLDFVMLFMPIEPAYLLAIQAEADLWSFAYDKRILLISPTNLIAALKMINSLWLQEHQNENARDIAQKSGDLYDKFVGLVEDLLDVGKKLKTTQTSYEGAMNKLSTGKGSLVKRAQDIKALGVKTKKNLPDNLLKRAGLGDGAEEE